jgi:hypothetical protein
MWGLNKIDKVTLGAEVRDTVTGFQGIAIAKHKYLHGCCRITIQPKANEDGTLPKCETFDEPQLEIINSKKHEKGDDSIGGPEKYSPGNRIEEIR